MSLTRWQCEFAKFFVSLFSVVDAEAKGPSGTCEDAAERAVLFSPTAPWKGVVANTPGSPRRHF